MKNGIIAPNTILSFTVQEEIIDLRIDSFLSAYFPFYSRTFFKKLIDQKLITLNGVVVSKPSVLIKTGDAITVQFPEEIELHAKPTASDMPVVVVFEHPDFLIINKPPYVTVHVPHKNSQEITLVDWLISKFKEIRTVGHEDRPGIVHRLDKNTSGLLIISRNNYAHEQLSNLFKNRLIKKTYLAVVKGHPEQSGVIDFPISRDPFVRTKMSHKYSSGRPSVTEYKVLEYFSDSALLELHPLTGRTHQLRVHCAALGHPIIGDDVYGTPSKLIKRQALHAYSLEFSYAGERYHFTADLPDDFKKLLDILRS